MLKNIARLESVIGSRVGHFLLDNDTPINIAKAMCEQFMNYLQQLEDQIKIQQDQAQKEAPQAEEPKVE